MNKQTIEVAALLLTWKRKYEGKQCSHVFTDVIIRGGPRIIYETVSSSERRCEGLYEVEAKTINRWERVKRHELVWLHVDGYERYEDVYIQVRCPVCRQGHRSDKFMSDWPVGRECKDANYDDIPF